MGHFKKGLHVNGQIDRSNKVYKALKIFCKEYTISKSNLNEFSLFPIELGKKIAIAKKILLGDIIIIIACKKGIFLGALLKILFPVKKVLFIAIGNHIFSFNRIYHYFINKVDKNFAQIPITQKEVSFNYSKNKISTLPNFTFAKPHFSKFKHNKPIQLYFAGRIAKNKGAFFALEVFLELNKIGSYSLDFFGTIDLHERRHFFHQLMEINKTLLSSQTRYCGVYRQTNIAQKLKKYDAMIFPSFYQGECFPGVFVDAFYQNKPIFSSKWKFHHRILEETNTGWVISGLDAKKWAHTIHKNVQSRKNMNRVKKNIFLFSKEISPRSIFKRFILEAGL